LYRAYNGPACDFRPFYDEEQLSQTAVDFIKFNYPKYALYIFYSPKLVVQTGIIYENKVKKENESL